jgi:hypothetical protein
MGPASTSAQWKIFHPSAGKILGSLFARGVANASKLARLRSRTVVARFPTIDLSFGWSRDHPTNSPWMVTS